MIVKLEKVKRKVEIDKIAPKLIPKTDEKPTTNHNINSVKFCRAVFISKSVQIIAYELIACLRSNFSAFFVWHSLSSLSHFISEALLLRLLQPPAITGKLLVTEKTVRQAKVINGNKFFMLLLSYVNLLCFINQ